MKVYLRTPVLTGLAIVAGAWCPISVNAQSAFDGRTWAQTTTLPQAAYQYEAVEANGYLYILGGYNDSGPLDTAWFAQIQPNGGLGNWSPTTSLPTVDQGPGVAAANGYLYIAMSHGDVYRAKINSGGLLGPWVQEATAETEHGGRLSLKSYGGHLFLSGGFYYSDIFDDVYVATINGDGSLSPWTATTPMPGGHQHMATHFYNSRMYIVGGVTDGNGITGAAYSARVNGDGTLGAWRSETGLDHPLWMHNTVLIGNSMYLFGGRTSYGNSGARTEVLRASIDTSTGLVGTWSSVGSVPDSFNEAAGTVYVPSVDTVYYIGGWRTAGDFTGAAWIARRGDLEPCWDVLTHFTGSPAPLALTRHMMAYDEARGLCILVGGRDISRNLRPETMAWDGQTWTQVSTSGPSARRSGAMVYDSIREEIVLFGGLSAGDYYDPTTWLWNGTSWQPYSGTTPGGRGWHCMAFDKARGETVLFGGQEDVSSAHTSDTWTWDGVSWTLAATAGPTPREVSAMAYDEQRERVVLFGGIDVGSNFRFDTWEWDGTSWTEMHPAHHPGDRVGHTLTYDAAHGVVVAYGGTDRYHIWEDMWAWDGTDWTRLPDPPIDRRTGHATAYDTARQRLVIHGGEQSYDSVYLNETVEIGCEVQDCDLDGIPDDVDNCFCTYNPDQADADDDGIGDVCDNLPPVADAGPDQCVNEGEEFVVDGSASYDPNGDALTYFWEQVPGGPTVPGLPASGVSQTLIAPLVPMGGATATFQLTVHDREFCDSDTVNITIRNINHPPHASAGDDQEVAEGVEVMLDGSNSWDEDGETLTYEWVQTGGTHVDLNNPNTVSPNFSAPWVGHAGETFTFRLKVCDGAESDCDYVSVRVTDIDHPPEACVGPDLVRNEGTCVTLDARCSSDPDGDYLTFQWLQLSGPGVTLSDPTSLTPSFCAPMVGQDGAALVFKVTVDDGYGMHACTTVSVFVQDTNAPPRCELAYPSVAELWPPNHKLVPITIQGITDPENAHVGIVIVDVRQDEPINGTGDGDTAPDAVLQGNTVLIRAERAGNGNGRVYHIVFMADDGEGGVCYGEVLVRVPKDKGKNSPPAVDGGSLYSSLH